VLATAKKDNARPSCVASRISDFEVTKSK
jgi:hypothetical protein